MTSNDSPRDRAQPPTESRRGLSRVEGATLAEKLAAQAAEAADLRALATNPDVVALRVEHIRRQVDVMAWSGIVLGLGFTMVNVQMFAARSAEAWSLQWVAAWLLDPMVSLFVIALLRTQQVCARWQVRPGPWVRRGVWSGLAATYAMNTWSAWEDLDWSLILLHSVPVVVVAMGAEALTDAREALTRAIAVAARPAPDQPPPTAQAPAHPVGGPPAQVGGDRAADTAGATVEVDAAGVEGVGEDEPAGPPPAPSRLGGARRRRAPAVRPVAGRRARGSRPAPSGSTAAGGTTSAARPARGAGRDAERVARLQQAADQRGAVPSRDAAKDLLGCGSSTAERLLAQVRQPRPIATTNGAHA